MSSTAVSYCGVDGFGQPQPGAAIGQRTGRNRLLLGYGLVLSTEALDALGPDDFDRRKQAEIDVHGLKRPFAWLVVRTQVPAGDVSQQGA